MGTLHATQRKTNFTMTMLQNIPKFNGQDSLKLEDWFMDIETTVDILTESHTHLAEAKSCSLTQMLIHEAIQQKNTGMKSRVSLGWSFVMQISILYCSTINHGEFLSYQPIFFYPWLCCPHGMWLPLFIYIWASATLISYFCCWFDVLCRHSYQNIYFCVDRMYTYVHAQYFLVIVPYVIMTWQSICCMQFWTWLVQNVHNLLMYTQHDAVQPLWQCHNIFANHGHKWLMVSDVMYFTCKAVVMKFSSPCCKPSVFSFSVAVLSLCAGEILQKKFGGDLHHTQSSCALSSATNWLQGLCQVHLSVGIWVWSNKKWMHTLL